MSLITADFHDISAEVTMGGLGDGGARGLGGLGSSGGGWALKTDLFLQHKCPLNIIDHQKLSRGGSSKGEGPQCSMAAG